MSRFSGVCDLFDLMSGLGGWYDKDGNQIKIGEVNGPYYSDELQDFTEFKKRTGGVLYQHKCIKNIYEYKHDFIKKHCNGFDYVEHVKQVPDKRCTNGFREEKYFTYTYYGKEYTKKELEKKGVYITIEIIFNTILDLIKYYPYTVASCASCDDKMTVIISSRSDVDEQFDELIQYGSISSKAYYDRELQAHYREVCENYILKNLEERTYTLFIDKSCWKRVGDTYEFTVSDKEFDDNYPVTFDWLNNEPCNHMDSPRIKDSHTICILAVDMDYFLAEAIKNRSVFIKYVIKPSSVYLH